MSEMMTVASVMYLHAIVWLWMRPCVSRLSLSRAPCHKGTVGCVVYHGDETWELPHGDLAMKLGLIAPDGGPILAEMRKV